MSDVEAAATIEALVQRCRQGDLCAFTTLFARFQDRLYDLAWAILQDEAEAEDAVQDTLLRVFERIGRYRGASSFETWLVAVTVNVCRDRCGGARCARSFRWTGSC
jgi:RNA polymerase sigma-70 factor (ECF subfamily)